MEFPDLDLWFFSESNLLYFYEEQVFLRLCCQIKLTQDQSDFSHWKHSNNRNPEKEGAYTHTVKEWSHFAGKE